jgi:transposase
VDVAESTVRAYVRKRKLGLGLERGEVFIPQSYRWGQEGQVDWSEAYAEIDGEQQMVYPLCLRSMASDGAYHRAFIAFRSHWGFPSEFCTPGEGHEKGGVEGENGFYRRNHLVPVPKVLNWDELNALLLAECNRDEHE